MTPEKLIQQAVEEAVRRDHQSHPHISLLTSSERNIASHIRASLESIIRNSGELDGYQVDVEYNRQGEGDTPKRLGGENVVPDIIVHKRGITCEEDNDANYLFVEIKVIDNFNGERNSIRTTKGKENFDYDKHKLIFARSEKRYKHAAFLIFNQHGQCYLEIDNDAIWEDSFEPIFELAKSTFM